MGKLLQKKKKKIGMQNFQDTFETSKQSFIGAFSIYMTVPLKSVKGAKNWLKNTSTKCNWPLLNKKHFPPATMKIRPVSIKKKNGNSYMDLLADDT